MKKRLLIMMALLAAIVTGAWAATKTIYVYPKEWDMAGCKIALYAWNPSSMFDDLQKSTTYPECYTIEVDKELNTCILVQLPASASNDWANKINQTNDINLDGYDDNLLVVIKGKNGAKNLAEVTTIDHLSEYLTPTGSVSTDVTELDFDSAEQGADVVKKSVTVTNTTSGEAVFNVSVPDGFDWEHTILFTNNQGWSSVYFYYWNNGPSWPGVELTQYITNDYGQKQHIATIPYGTEGVIFSDGNNSQTDDISNFNCTGVYPTEISGGKYLVDSWGDVAQLVIPANSSISLNLVMKTDAAGVKSGNFVLTPESGDAITIAVSGTVADPGLPIDEEAIEQAWAEYAYDGEVGTIYSPEQTTFKVWNPLSTSVKLNLYATGSDIEEGSAKLDTYTMDKLMDGDSWTGIWTTTIYGDYKNKYYTYTIDGTEVSDPWALTAGKDNLRSMVCDEPATNPSGWNSDYHRFYEQGNAVKYIDVSEFSADPMCGVSEANRGKYLALTESGTTEGNAGEVLTCMSKLKEDGVKAIVIDIAAPLMMPDQYVSNPYDGNSLVSEFKQMVQAVHDTFGMSVFVRLDFSTIPPYDLPYQPKPDRYLLETCLRWVWEYHVDGIVLATDLSAETKVAVREFLNDIDARVLLATDAELEVLTGIETISRDDQPASGVPSATTYTLDGRKLNGQPTQRGIYIVNGKKVVK